MLPKLPRAEGRDVRKRPATVRQPIRHHDRRRPHEPRFPARRRILSRRRRQPPCSAPAGSRPAFAQAKEFKIGFFIALSGPAALFGPTQQACADLAAEKINKAGGILGRPVKLLFTDAGGPPAETAKSAVRLMLEDKVDLFIGSHDSATREANIATIKGKTPYIYSPVYEGGECSPNVFCLGETPPQQAQPAIEFLAEGEEAPRPST